MILWMTTKTMPSRPPLEPSYTLERYATKSWKRMSRHMVSHSDAEAAHELESVDALRVTPTNSNRQQITKITEISLRLFQRELPADEALAPAAQDAHVELPIILLVLSVDQNIAHLDIKLGNILLDKDYLPRI